METLLDAADALASSEKPDVPDFPIPDAFRHLEEPTTFLHLRESPGKGQGWFASRDLPAGTHILVSKPIAMVMHWEDEEDTPMQSDNPNGGDGGAQGEQEDAMEDANEEDDDEQRFRQSTIDDIESDPEGDAVFGEPEPEPRINELLLIDILEDLQGNPNIWFQKLTHMFPRSNEDLSKLPAWVCPDDSMFMQVEASLEQLRAVLPSETVKEISKRLPHIVRYNILSVETCSELLSYPGPGGHSSLSGVALYHYPSFFNHSARPNCSRWAIGDIMFFVTNQTILSGQEVCISYIEHDVLCESAYRRNLMLRMDFQDAASPGHGEASISGKELLEKDGPEMPVVDPDVQNELMSMDPFERLKSIDDLLQQARGEKPPQDDVTGSQELRSIHPTSGWFQCDVHNLCILKAITLDGLGQTSGALELWEQAVEFCERSLPPADESLVPLRAQAALCAFHMGDLPRAQHHAKVAVETHHLLFGGGLRFFRRRCRRDLELKLRPSQANHLAGASPIDMLWPLNPLQ